MKKNMINGNNLAAIKSKKPKYHKLRLSLTFEGFAVRVQHIFSEGFIIDSGAVIGRKFNKLSQPSRKVH